MKYVIGYHTVTSQFHVAVFGEEIIHKEIAVAMKKSNKDVEFVSAGFVYKQDGKWSASDEKSDSLKLGPSEHDQVILTAFLDLGLTGLDLQNWIAYQNIAKGRRV